jgi:LuxR family maltose regulon positive regulatory protein
MRWHWSEMATRLEAAVAAARRAGDSAELQLSQACLLAAWNATGRDERSNALLQELSGQTLEPHAAVLVLDAQCTLHFQRGEYDRLPALFGQVMHGLEQLGSLLAWWECSPPTAWAGLPGMRSVLEHYCGEALRRCGERDLPMRATLHCLQAATHLWGGRIDAALAEARQAESDARWLARAAEIEVGLGILRVIVDAFQGHAESVQHRLHTLFTREDGNAAPDRLRFWRNHVGQLAVRVLDVLGSDAATLQHWGAYQQAPVPGDPPSPLAARIAAAEGRWHEAAEQFVALLPHTPRLDLMGQGSELHLRAAHALLQCGRRAEAAPLLASALERVLADGEAGHALMAGPAVLAALAAQDWGQAIGPRLRSALAELAAQSAALRGDLAAPTSRNDAASREVQIGAMALLSSRQREVLERVAAGDSNKLIARSLDISPHTVKRHVANILDKLDLGSRGQAAAWLRQHG